MRAVAEARRSGALQGGVTLAVGLMLADSTDRRSGETTIGMRSLARLSDVALSTAHSAVAQMLDAGVIDVVDRGHGRRTSTYRFAFSTANAQPVDESSLRSPDGTLGESLRSASVRSAARNSGVAFAEPNSSLKDVYPNGDEPVDSALPDSSDDVVERVAELRSRLRPDARQQSSPTAREARL